MGDLVWLDGSTEPAVDEPAYYYLDDAGRWFDEDGEEVEFTDDEQERNLEIRAARSLGHPITNDLAEFLIEYADEHGLSILQAIEETREHGEVVRETHEWTDKDGRHIEERDVERRPIPEDKHERIADSAQIMEQDAEPRAGFQSQAPYYEEGMSPSNEEED